MPAVVRVHEGKVYGGGIHIPVHVKFAIHHIAGRLYLALFLFRQRMEILLHDLDAMVYGFYLRRADSQGTSLGYFPAAVFPESVEGFFSTVTINKTYRSPVSCYLEFKVLVGLPVFFYTKTPRYPYLYFIPRFQSEYVGFCYLYRIYYRACAKGRYAGDIRFFFGREFHRRNGRARGFLPGLPRSAGWLPGVLSRRVSRILGPPLCLRGTTGRIARRLTRKGIILPRPSSSLGVERQIIIPLLGSFILPLTWRYGCRGRRYW